MHSERDWLGELCVKGVDFALFCAMGSDGLELVLPDEAAEARFVLAPFAPGGAPLGIRGRHFSTTEKVLSVVFDLLKAREDVGRGPASEIPMEAFNEASRKNYVRAFGVFHRALEEGRFKKLVLSRPFRLPVERPLTSFFFDLLRHYPQSFRFFVKAENRVFCGATPEILCRKRGRRARIMSLAGTMPRTDEGVYAWSAKNIEEQAVVTQFILDSLKPLSEALTTDGPKTCHAGPVVHLLTDIEAKLREGVSLEDLVGALHPTPAVCGLPQREARDFILEHEGWERGFYAGWLGLIEGDAADLYVNLRSAVIEGSVATCFGGGGLLKASVLEDEWQETVRKISTLKVFLTHHAH